MSSALETTLKVWIAIGMLVGAFAAFAVCVPIALILKANAFLNRRDFG